MNNYTLLRELIFDSVTELKQDHISWEEIISALKSTEWRIKRKFLQKEFLQKSELIEDETADI